MKDIFNKNKTNESKKVLFKLYKFNNVLAFFLMAGILLIATLVIMLTCLLAKDFEYILKWIALGIGAIASIFFLVGVILAIVYITKYKRKIKREENMSIDETIKSERSTSTDKKIFKS